MNLLTYVFLILLWSSCFSYAQGKDETLPQSSVPIQSKAFTTYRDSLVDPSYNFKIENMPKIQSQDTVGSCFGCGPATIAQKYACDTDSGIKSLGINCASLPNDKLISQFSGVAWADTNDRGLPDAKQKEGMPESHANIRLYKEATKYSSGANALMHASSTFSFMPESCFPFDQLVKKYGHGEKGPNFLFENTYNKTKELYLKNRRKPTEADGICENCLKTISEDFGTSFSPAALSTALTKATYGQFLFTLIFHNCKPISFSQQPTFNQFPGEGETAEPKAKLFEKIKEVLDEKHPVLIRGVCLQYDSQLKKCSSSHTIVVNGYRRVCPATNLNSAPTPDLKSSECKLQVKLHNCWGQDWQNSNEQGWVNADSFIEHINFGKTHVSTGALSWLE